MISIVVDSTCALTRSEASKLGVTLVSATYTVDGRPVPESFMGENGDYDALLAANRVSDTASATADAFRQAFETQVAAGNDVLCITISSRLASTYRNACKAADQVSAHLAAGGPNVAVLDSASGFSNSEYLVRLARGLADAGMPFADVATTVAQARERQGICFSVPSTEPLRSMGRLAMVSLSVNTLLNRYPVFVVREGAIACEGTARGSRALAQAMVDQVPDSADDITLSYFGSRGPLIVELLRATKLAYPQARVRVKDGGPVLSRNLGRGSVSIAWAPADPNETDDGSSEE